MFEREPLMWAMYTGVWSFALFRGRSGVPFGTLQVHGSADTAPSNGRHEQHFRDSQAATVTTYKQMRGSSTAYDMQPYLLKIRGFWLHKAFASI